MRRGGGEIGGDDPLEETLSRLVEAEAAELQSLTASMIFFFLRRISGSPSLISNISIPGKGSESIDNKVDCCGMKEEDGGEEEEDGLSAAV